MAQRATSLGPKPSLFVLLVFVFLFLGHLTFVFFCFCLNSLKPCFAPKGHFCLFICVSLCFSLAFLEKPWASQFLSPYLSFPLFLFSLFWASPFFPFSFSLSCSFLSSFLPVFHFCFWFLLFLFVLFASWFQDVILFFFFPACCLVLF